MGDDAESCVGPFTNNVMVPWEVLIKRSGGVPLAIRPGACKSHHIGELPQLYQDFPSTMTLFGERPDTRFRRHPPSLTFWIVNGTGAYANSSGKGRNSCLGFFVDEKVSCSDSIRPS